MKIRVMLGVLAVLLFSSCDQYPIFYAISQEVEPKEPRVKGSPTAIVEIGGTMYVASRFGKTIHYYKERRWDSMPSPGGNIMELATDGKYLYALTGDPLGETEVYHKEVNNDTWSLISGGVGGAVQTICGARGANGGYIFASTATGLFVYNTDGTAGFSLLLPDISKENIVTGAALLSSIYYVAVVNKGIYTLTETPSMSLNLVGGTEGKPIVGMLAAGDKIVAVSRESGSGSGSLFYGDSSGFAEAQKSVAFSGAMTLWSANKTPASASDLLLVGIQAPSYSTVNGYREITLNNGNLATAPLGLGTPGESGVSTVSSTDSYVSTIGLRIVTALYQAADNTIFASTTTRGLWSYRNDVWNAED